MCDCHDDKKSNFLTGLVAGALVGVGIYYFFTNTDQGRKLGKQIKNKSEDLADDFGDLVKDIEDKSQDFQKKAIRLEKQIKEDVVEKAEDLQEGVVEKLADIKEGIGEQISHLAEINDEVVKLQEKGRQAAGKFFSRQGKPIS